MVLGATHDAKEAPVVDDAVLERLRVVDQRMDLVDNDVHQLRDVAERAESIAESASAATVGLSQRLEHLEQSNEALFS
uniref:Uncharacterized protein n=1 Tax=Hyaloperonospora arabidopsidis (strain Emoy2) TaxID=559515 RepID=M4B618_HYAAE